MALNLYTGQPGAGKSYSIVANVVIPALKKGRHVVTNIPLEVDLLVEVYGGQITQLPLDCLYDPDLPDTLPNGAVVIVDECWVRWPSGQRLTKAPKGDQHWLKEHRHRVDSQGNSMQVVLATQNPADLAKWVRDLIRHTFFMDKLETVGMENKFSIKIYKGCPTGENIPKRYLLRTTYGTYEEDIYQYYSSATQSQSGTVGDEIGMDKRTSIWSSPSLWFQLIGSPILFLGSVGFLIYGGWRLSHGDEDKVAKVETVKEQPKQVAPVQLTNPMPPGLSEPKPGLPTVQVPSPAAQVQSKQPSTVWRVAGYMDRSPDRTDAAWASKLGYGDVPDQPRVKIKPGGGFAILTSLAGVRYVPLSDCKPYPDGFNYSCDVDGERATPWSGQMGYTEISPRSAVSGARTVPAERSETGIVPAPVPARSGQIRSTSELNPVSSSASGAHAQQAVVTVVPDTEYSSRPWRSQQ